MSISLNTAIREQDVDTLDTNIMAEARLIQIENSHLMKLVNESQRKLSLFKEGILKLKEYYDMQMMIMKSHLHGEENESIETFFSKLIKIMELAKQMFQLLDLSSFDDSFSDSGGNNVIGEQLQELRNENSNEVSLPPTEHINETIINITALPSQNIADNTVSTASVISQPPPITTTILSPRFDGVYTNHDVMHEQRISLQRYNPEELMLPLPSSNAINYTIGNNITAITNSTVVSEETCPFCKNNFTTRRDLNRHMRTHTGEKPFSCAVCSKDFSRKDFLLKHKLTHTGEKPHTCSECNKSFSQRSNLNKHLLTHTKVHRFVCKLCRRGFHQMINLHRHEQLHCNSNKQFQCTWCSKVHYQGFGCLKTLIDKRESNAE